jgi:hypothetical protein
MQTFLPYPDFAASAKVLDYRRLGKQRVETFQLLNAIRGVDKFGEPKQHKGWVNHPAAVMWRQYVPALAMYGVAMSAEWIARGYNDTMYNRLEKILTDTASGEVEMPYWFGREEFHISHQSNLLRKDYGYYSQFFHGVPVDLEYVWFPEFAPRVDLTSVTLVA